ncbi:hypothetical protein GCM10022404_07430 [Celeribacter arenosi]|uniref:Uncharacterized protein n=1 Tax=Celeribacter arenosi TaxID=792649 RepID=A0ABP7JXY3_9RHOB
MNGDLTPRTTYSSVPHACGINGQTNGGDTEKTRAISVGQQAIGYPNPKPARHAAVT